jgi:cytidylate kinase
MNIGVKIYEPESVETFASTLTITVQHLHPKFQFELDGKKVRKLNTLQIDKVVPTIAAYASIRASVRRIQREIAAQGNIILAGRDIGTVVLPDADLKIYLDVSLEERATRRFARQNESKRTLEEVRHDILMRDLADTTRHESPMQAADDAVIICTDGLAVEAVVAIVLERIHFGEQTENAG